MMRIITDRKGFSLIQILIAITVLGILLMISIPLFSSQTESNKESEDLANMRKAKNEAVLEYMYTNNPGPYYYDATNGTVSLDEKPAKGYGRSTKSVNEFYEVMPGAYGVPNEDGNANYITVMISGAGIEIRWGGNDLSTSLGRRIEDLENMHKISEALIKADKSNLLKFNKDYVEVAVFKDCTMHYFNNSNSGTPWSEESTRTIKEALDRANIATDKMTIYDTDGEWQNGYMIHYEDDGTVRYKTLTSYQNEEEHIGFSWWNNQDISEE